jgi:hypothetical protein
METLKEQCLDEVIDMLMSVALGLISNGVLLTEVASQTNSFYKLSAEQTHIECHEIQDPSLLEKRASILPSNSEKSINVFFVFFYSFLKLAFQKLTTLLFKVTKDLLLNWC